MKRAIVIGCFLASVFTVGAAGLSDWFRMIVPSSGGSAVSATGGTVTNIGSYKYHVFSVVGSNTLSVSVGGSAEVLIVGGGGSSGWKGRGAGAGGAGGVISTNISLTAGSITVVVGSGGAQVSSDVNGNNGNPSVFGAISVVGGGGGAVPTGTGLSGACGGGGGSSLNGGAGTIGGSGAKGLAGGDYHGGGGGGMSQYTNVTTATPNGGAGIYVSSFTNWGVAGWYGGGGASGKNSGTLGTPGQGGGGTGDRDVLGGDGVANTGGGGGSGSGAGGSGIVIVRYAQ